MGGPFGGDRGQRALFERLRFLHIPNGGGGPVERVGKALRVHWWRQANWTRQKYPVGGAAATSTTCSAWRVPLRFLPQEEEERRAAAPGGGASLVNQGPGQGDGSGELSGQERRVFCVLQHPFARVVHEFKREWRQQHGQNVSSCTPAELNAFLLRVLSAVKKGDAYRDDCAWLPQAEYVWEDQRMVCQETLHMDQLEKQLVRMLQKAVPETPKLAERLEELTHRVLHAHRRSSSSESACEVSVRDLQDEVKCLVRQVYAVDFARLNFPTDSAGIEEEGDLVATGRDEEPGWWWQRRWGRWIFWALVIQVLFVCYNSWERAQREAEREKKEEGQACPEEAIGGC